MSEHNVVGSIPEFTSDEGVQRELEEVKQEVAEATVEEKETPTEPPAESVETEQKPVPEVEQSTEDVDAGALIKQVSGLKEEREKLLREVQALRGTRRELKQQEIARVDQKIQQVSDDLKDLNPDDVSVIDRVLRSKGYLTKEESAKMFYDAVKNEEINKFLDKFPEYKPENDPDDLNWNALQRQFKWADGSPRLSMPSDPRLIGEVLLQAHRELVKPGDRGAVEVKKQQVKVASSGSAGAQRSSPKKTANPRLSSLLRSHMHGWSQDEIASLEQKLSE